MSGFEVSTGKRRRRARRIRGWRALVLLFLAIGIEATCVAATFHVNSAADVPDANPGDGVCETAPGNGICTLRAAVQESNALPGADTIVLQANTTYLLTRVGIDDTGLNGDLDVFDSLAIVGAGAGSTVIDANGSVTGDRAFSVFQCIGNAAPAPDGGCPTGNVFASISAVTIQHGNGASGGAIANSGQLAIEHCDVIDNVASYGGAIATSGTLTVRASRIAGNSAIGANSSGGGIVFDGVSGSTTISYSTVSDNSASRGGGIYAGATTIVESSTISANTAQSGGGVFNGGTGSLSLVNSTVSGNFSNGDGGGIRVADGSADLFNVTVTRNQANADDTTGGIGGGVAVDPFATLNFANTIIAENEIGIAGSPLPTLGYDECAGTITSQGNDIVDHVDATHCTVLGTVTYVDPALGSLQNNGGPTQTHALLPGSPAIDAGNAAGCTDDLGAPLTSDQRGDPRPVGAACDIGAFEVSDVLFRNGFEF